MLVIQILDAIRIGFVTVISQKPRWITSLIWKLNAKFTMVDIFLVVSTAVALFILFVVAVYLLVYYQHPDDHNEAYFPKGVVIGGIMLAGATALLLPLDVANNEGYAGTWI